jgi:hypothetical protein
MLSPEKAGSAKLTHTGKHSAKNKPGRRQQRFTVGLELLPRLGAQPVNLNAEQRVFKPAPG